MIVNKCTIGYVTQRFDTEKKEWLSQDFIAGDECTYEDEQGADVEPEVMHVDGKEPYLPFLMKQPEEFGM
tara:strand:+ start:481 stop:690 length:210 start_codon:yes stop_codon:yes gene_type:complete